MDDSTEGERPYLGLSGNLSQRWQKVWVKNWENLTLLAGMLLMGWEKHSRKKKHEYTMEMKNSRRLPLWLEVPLLPQHPLPCPCSALTLMSSASPFLTILSLMKESLEAGNYFPPLFLDSLGCQRRGWEIALSFPLLFPCPVNASKSLLTSGPQYPPSQCKVAPPGSCYLLLSGELPQNVMS